MRLPVIFAHLYTIIVFVLGWALFYYTDFGALKDWFLCAFGGTGKLYDFAGFYDSYVESMAPYCLRRYFNSGFKIWIQVVCEEVQRCKCDCNSCACCSIAGVLLLYF